MKSVLFLLGTLETGGSETKFVRLARRLSENGKSVHVAYLNGPETLLAKLAGIRVVNLQRKGKWSLGACRRLSRYVEQNAICSIVCANFYPLAYAVPLAMLKRTADLKVIVSINTSEFSTDRERRFMRIYLPLIRRCDRIVFGSSRQQKQWLRTYDLSARQACVIHNGVDGIFFEPAAVTDSRKSIRSELSIPDNDNVVVCVSRFRPEKAHRDLLDAIARLAGLGGKSTHLLLVGDGPESENIVREAKRLGIFDRLHMVGLTDDVRPYLKMSDVFALTSTAVETFSNAALEAAAMGLPVVMSDMGGASEMFPEESQGIVYPPGDVRSLTDALQKSLSDSRSGRFDRTRMRNDVLQKFSIDAMDAAWNDAIWGRAA